jgi:hypothetical protein
LWIQTHYRSRIIFLKCYGDMSDLLRTKYDCERHEMAFKNINLKDEVNFKT